MPKFNEVIDSLSDEQTVSEIREALKAEATALVKQNSQLYQRAKKAEGFEYSNDTKTWVKKEKPKPEAPAGESNEPDYSKIAYLNTVGLTNPDDQQWVQDESKRLKLPLTDILQMEHAKLKLQNDKDTREAMGGMPKGKGRGGGQTKHEVDYWLDKKKPDGTYETPEDPELAVKVIDARIKKESNVSKFSDILFTG